MDSAEFPSSWVEHSTLATAVGQRGPVVLLEEVGRIAVDRDAPRPEEFLFRPAAAEQPHGAETGLPGRLGVVGGIAHDDHPRGIDPAQAIEGGLEDIRVGLGRARGTTSDNGGYVRLCSSVADMRPGMVFT
jgi:hypothetical protein